MIKVCHVISGDLWSGAEVMTFELLRELQKCSSVDLVAVLFNRGILEQRLRQQQIRVRVLQERGMLHNPALMRQFRTFLDGERPDVLHSHRPKENLLSGMAGKTCGVSTLVSTLHGAAEPFKGLSGVKYVLFHAANRFILSRRFHHIVCVSRHLRDSLGRTYPEAKLRVIHNGICPGLSPDPGRKCEARQESGLPSGKRYVGYFGRLTPIKGLDVLIDAARLVCDQMADARFLVVGDGPLRDDLERRAGDLLKRGIISFTGFREDVTSLLRTVDVVALSSHNEGIPMILLEAMAGRVPIVATRVGGIPEIVRDGENGVLVPPADSVALAEGILSILGNEERAEAMGLAGRHLLEKEYSASVMAQKYLELYSSPSPRYCDRPGKNPTG